MAEPAPQLLPLPSPAGKNLFRFDHTRAAGNVMVWGNLAPALVLPLPPVADLGKKSRSLNDSICRAGSGGGLGVLISPAR